jgi:hypothetical protein
VSYDFTFWESYEPLEDAEAGEIHASLMTYGVSDRARPSARIARMAAEIESHWPVPGSGREDDWPLAAPVEATESYLAIALVPSRLWDVWPTLSDLAQKYELVMYDPQQRGVFLPRRLSRKRTQLRAKRRRPGQ